MNGPDQCKRAVMAKGGSRCECKQYPELVAVMKSRHLEVWEKNGGHIFMALEDVPWKLRDVGTVNLGSEMTGSGEHVESEAWEQMLKAAERVAGKGTVGAAEAVMRAVKDIRIDRKTDSGDRRSREGRVAEMSRKCSKGEGLVISGLDRDCGRSWMCCAELNDEVGRRHFESCNSKSEYGEQSDLKYWKVDIGEKALLKSWEKEYRRLNEVKCGGRWRAWGRRGAMCRVRWQFKREKIHTWEWGVMIRAIFSGVKDPASKEMAICAEGVGLINRTLELDDFSKHSGMEMAVFFKEAETQLREVYGAETQIEIDSTDFKNFFPSNSKWDVVKHLKEALGLIYSGEGQIAIGYQRPKNRWFTAPMTGKGKARWGRSAEQGWVNRKVDDIVVLLEFRAAVANLFCVGDQILGSEEVIIGEQTSPGLCDLKARLSERKMRSTIPANQMAVYRAGRFADDGIRLSAVDGRSGGTAASRALVEAVKVAMAAAYPGVEVTEEGRATAEGGEVELLEYKIGVQATGKQLWWHHKSKDIEQILGGGGQRFRRLRHWQSGTSGGSLLRAVKGRLDDMAMMTRADHSGSKGVSTERVRQSGQGSGSVCARISGGIGVRIRLSNREIGANDEGIG